MKIKQLIGRMFRDTADKKIAALILYFPEILRRATIILRKADFWGRGIKPETPEHKVPITR